MRAKNFPFLEAEPGKDKAVVININEIQANPYQPRRTFPAEKIRELTQSIRTYGLLQPIIVRRVRQGYQLVVGQRRLMACRELGWKTITATEKDLSDSAMAAIALIENLQRENLNFLEEAAGYARLMDEFNLTQEALAQRLGKSQSTIANKLRLLKLPGQVKKALLEGNLTERHARALLKLESVEQQQKILQEIIEKDFTVNQTEKRIEGLLGKTPDHQSRRQVKAVIRDFRIFLNTIREAVKIIEGSGLSPEVEEKVEPDYVEVTIRLSKNRD